MCSNFYMFVRTGCTMCTLGGLALLTTFLYKHFKYLCLNLYVYLYLRSF